MPFLAVAGSYWLSKGGLGVGIYQNLHPPTSSNGGGGKTHANITGVAEAGCIGGLPSPAHVKKNFSRDKNSNKNNDSQGQYTDAKT